MTEQPQDHQQQQPSQSQPIYPMPQDSPQPHQGFVGQPYNQQQLMSPADQRTWAIVAHLSTFLAVMLGGLSFLGPLAVYIVFRERGPFVRSHAAEALNFQITMWIGLLISFVLMFVIVGFFTAAAIGLAMLICHILAAVAASEGRDYRYPFTIRFVS